MNFLGLPREVFFSLGVEVWPTLNSLIQIASKESPLMRYKLVSHGRQMELPVSSWLSTGKVVTGVVPATAPPMAKLEQDNNSQNWKIIGIF